MVDPRGSVIFISELFTGSMSDKEICEKSGFNALPKSFVKDGRINKGIAIMADKGFVIEKELGKIDLKLNIPPFAPAAAQMSAGNMCV